jgi:tRNA-Thr(GGU) m(6)t(6)A37 methyltransferase TsaA
MAASLRPIAVVRSSLTEPALAPKQGQEGAPDAWIEIRDEFTDGLDGLRAGQSVLLITWLHLAERQTLKVHPRDDLAAPLTGVFATRSADRPNPLGLHQVTIRRIMGSRIEVGPLEAVDGTPVVDIKPVLSAAQ